jgi:hypothetical protein
MTFKRKWSPTGELTDAEIQHVLAMAERDSALLDAQHRLVQTLWRTRDNPDRDEDLLDDLWGEFLVEIKRVAVAAYPRTALHDMYEVKAQLVERALDEIRNGEG